MTGVSSRQINLLRSLHLHLTDGDDNHDDDEDDHDNHDDDDDRDHDGSCRHYGDFQFNICSEVLPLMPQTICQNCLLKIEVRIKFTGVCEYI